jgi:hypothetical protein
MPIVPSRARDIHELVRRLGSEKPAERDAAAARLRLLGERALPALIEALRAPDRRARLAALQALEGVAPRRALARVLPLVEDTDPEVARSAIEWAVASPGPGVASALARATHGDAPVARAAVQGLGRLAAGRSAEALDALLAVLLDEERPETLRLHALDALPGLAAPERRAVLGRLRGTRSPALAARVAALEGRKPRPAGDDLEAVHRALGEASDAALPALLDVVERRGAPASLPALRRLLDRLGPAPGREGRARAEVAARVHGLLAAMGSRIALYDLRERLSARPVATPGALLEAAARIGDASLAPALAALAAEAPALAPACVRSFRAIVAREKLVRRSAALRAVRPEHRAALEMLWGRRGR